MALPPRYLPFFFLPLEEPPPPPPRPRRAPPFPPPTGRQHPPNSSDTRESILGQPADPRQDLRRCGRLSARDWAFDGYPPLWRLASERSAGHHGKQCPSGNTIGLQLPASSFPWKATLFGQLQRRIRWVREPSLCRRRAELVSAKQRGAW